MKSLPILVALMAICATSVAVTSPRKVPTFELQDKFKTEPFDISVDDLQLPIRSRADFKSSVVPEDVMRLNGKRVRMIGQMYNPIFRAAPSHFINSFVFSGDTQKDGEPVYIHKMSNAALEQLIMVELTKGSTAEPTTGVIQVEGRLTIEVERWYGAIRFLYKIEEATIRPAKREEGFRPSLLSLPVFTC